MENKDQGPQKIKNIFNILPQTVKPPTHKWQDLALRVIKEINPPGFKRNSVFKICKDNHEELVLKALNDTKELCKNGERWQYFFKVINNLNQKTPKN